MKINNRLINPYERMDGEITTSSQIKEVSSLDSIDNPDSNTVYKIDIKYGINKNYIFGKEYDMFDFTNAKSYMDEIILTLVNKGITEDDAEMLIAYVMYFLCSTNLSRDGITVINQYNNGKYILKNNIFGNLNEELADYAVDESFDTLEELVNGIEKLILEKVPAVKEALKNNNLEYKYTLEPLNDINLFLNVVEKEGEPTYKYYIWNGEKYIEVFKDIEEKVVIERQFGTESYDDKGDYTDFNYSLSEDEFNLLRDNKAILHLYKKSEIESISAQQDTYLIPCSYEKLKFEAANIDINTITFISAGEYNISYHYLYKNSLDKIYTRSISQSVNLTPGNSKPRHYHSAASYNTLFGILENTNEDLSTPYINKGFRVYTANYNGTIEKLTGNYDSSFNNTLTSLNSSDSIFINSILSILVDSKLGCCSGIITLDDTQQGKTTLCLYDDSENKPIYINISFNISSVINYAIEEFKVYKDGTDITSDFLKNQFSSLDIYLL